MLPVRYGITTTVNCVAGRAAVRIVGLPGGSYSSSSSSGTLNTAAQASSGDSIVTVKGDGHARLSACSAADNVTYQPPLSVQASYKMGD